MKFRALYKAVMNNRLPELDKRKTLEALNNAILVLSQERNSLLSSIFGRKTHMSGKTCKYSEGASEATKGKPGPWNDLIESDRILKKLDRVSFLHERVSLVKKHMKVE
jgi:hypothetical protein